MKKNRRILTLHRETLLNLNSHDVARAEGAREGNSGLCIATLNNTCPYTCLGTCLSCPPCLHVPISIINF